MVLSQALNGLLVSTVLKHGGSITRLFVVSCSLVVNAALSAALLRLQLTATFFLAALLIGLAVRLYYGSRQPPTTSTLTPEPVSWAPPSELLSSPSPPPPQKSCKKCLVRKAGKGEQPG